MASEAAPSQSRRLPGHPSNNDQSPSCDRLNAPLPVQSVESANTGVPALDALCGGRLHARVKGGRHRGPSGPFTVRDNVYSWTGPAQEGQKKAVSQPELTLGESYRDGLQHSRGTRDQGVGVETMLAYTAGLSPPDSAKVSLKPYPHPRDLSFPVFHDSHQFIRHHPHLLICL